MTCLQPIFENHMEKHCLICNQELIGRQSKYCSVKCKNLAINNKHQNYITQQERGKQRRQSLIQLKGGCCEKCGYNRNQAALAFHHINPSTKSFQIDMRKCSNSSWETLVAESQKCLLLCLNCHAEVHNPDFST